MRTKRLMGMAERRALEVLEEAFSGTEYRVSSKVRVADVLLADGEEFQRLSLTDRRVLTQGHFDFVVYEGPDWKPCFAVEFDGPLHQQDARQIERDIRKNRLCMQSHFSLFRIGPTELEEHDKASLLEHMVHRFVAWKREQDQIKSQTDSPELRRLLRILPGIAVGMDGDPTIEFHSKYPFPGSVAIIRRLLDRFGILIKGDPLPDDLRATLNPDDIPLRCFIFPWEVWRDDPHVVTYQANYGIYRHNPGGQDFRWSGRILTPGLDVLCEGTTRFSMRETLKVGPAEDDYVTTFAPGISIRSITMHFSEYLALREVEKWAEAHLLRLVNDPDVVRASPPARIRRS